MVGTTMVTALGQGWNGDHMDMDGWGWGMMALVLIVVIALIGVLVYVATRDSGHRSNRGGADPIDVLDHRFARGEIDEEEYRKRRDVLRG